MTRKRDSDLDILECVEKSPQLTSFIIRSRTVEARKDTIIIALVAGFTAFVCGFMVGINLFNIAQPRNIVEVQVEKG